VLRGAACFDMLYPLRGGPGLSRSDDRDLLGSPILFGRDKITGIDADKLVRAIEMFQHQDRIPCGILSVSWPDLAGVPQFSLVDLETSQPGSCPLYCFLCTQQPSRPIVPGRGTSAEAGHSPFDNFFDL